MEEDREREKAARAEKAERASELRAGRDAVSGRRLSGRRLSGRRDPLEGQVSEGRYLAENRSAAEGEGEGEGFGGVVGGARAEGRGETIAGRRLSARPFESFGPFGPSESPEGPEGGASGPEAVARRLRSEPAHLPPATGAAPPSTVERGFVLGVHLRMTVPFTPDSSTSA